MTVSTATARPRAVLVSVWLPKVSKLDHEASLAELARLVGTLGFDVVATLTQRRAAMDRSVVLGGGKLAALARLTGGTGVVPAGKVHKPNKAQQKFEKPAEPEQPQLAASIDEDGEEHDDGIVIFDHGNGEDPIADVIVVDNEISPAQMRHLEKANGVEVLDRTAVIIEIFHRHAHTREARLQVEIARLHYEAPRLREKHISSDRQRAGGTGGKGETDLEVDRHRVRDRLAELRRELETVQKTEQSRRKQRSGNSKVALVGYTNAGKSSLMRALTGSEVLVADKLFATLGTTVRALQPETHPRILISDTVGFIKDLPHDLVASFRSTLEEAHDASLLLFVVDASDPSFRAQLEVTRTVLKEMGAEVPQQLILNKIDRVGSQDRALLRAEFRDAIQLSAHAPNDVADLYKWIVAFFEKDMVEKTLVIPHTARGVIGEVRQHTKVVSEDYDERGAILTLRAPAAIMGHIESLLKR